jgi:RHS repeat-associated protein
VVQYTYDAWGNILTTTGTLAESLGVINPLTYRGYVYDQETGLYYLQSRYYNPTIGRFINADALVATGQGLTGNNMFTYCGNNPVNRYDNDGESWLIIGAAIIATVIPGISNAVSAAKNGYSWEDCLLAGFVGAGSGFIGFLIAAATQFSFGGGVLARGVSSAICDLGTAWVLNGEITEQDIATTAVDVTMDMCFSTVTYYYNPIDNLPAQTFVNSAIDGSFDVFETDLYYSTPVNDKNMLPQLSSCGSISLTSTARRDFTYVACAV